MKKLIPLLAVLLLAGGAAAWYFLRSSNGATKYRVAKIEKGELRVRVSATGTVQPFLQVQVGTQVTGNIQKLLVDFNSRVKAGDLVAQIDPAPFQSKVDQDRANVAKSESDVGRVKASLTQAEKELARSRELMKKELISAADLDAAIASYDSLIAQVKVAEAAVAQSKAILQSSEVNLSYTTIRSPIDGIVISRNVDVGQTVAASLSAPTIYVIADEMKTVQIQASVAEADIGRIKVDQHVTFVVDAYRTQKFTGTVSQIRLLPTTVQNVVTYTVMIGAENPGARLLPGMTATVSFEIAQYPDTLKIPNAALRFVPPGVDLATLTPAPSPAQAPADAPKDAPPQGERRREPRGDRDRSQGRVWIQGPEGPVMVPVTIGATDGSVTQLLKGDLQEGQEIILGVQSEVADAMTNPFAPGRMGGGGGRGR